MNDSGIFGGGVAKMGKILLDPIRAVVNQRVKMFPVDNIRIELSAVGEGTGLFSSG